MMSLFKIDAEDVPFQQDHCPFLAKAPFHFCKKTWLLHSFHLWNVHIRFIPQGLISIGSYPSLLSQELSILHYDLWEQWSQARVGTETICMAPPFAWPPLSCRQATQVPLLWQSFRDGTLMLSPSQRARGFVDTRFPAWHMAAER